MGLMAALARLWWGRPQMPPVVPVAPGLADSDLGAEASPAPLPDFPARPQAAVAVAPAPPAPVVVPPALKPPWLVIAEKELGTRELPGPQHNARILEYHQATGLRAQTDEIAWCSAFANWCMRQAGIPGTGSALARSWLAWGEVLAAPRLGCVCILSRGEPWQGHVGFWIEERGPHTLLLGGNQANSVNISSYTTTRVLGYRWPSASLWPPEPPRVP